MQQNREILRNTDNPYTKVLDIYVASVSIRQQHKEILIDTPMPYTEVLSMHVTSVSIMQQHRDILTLLDPGGGGFHLLFKIR